MSSQPECHDLELDAIAQAGIKFAIVNNRIVVPVPFLDGNGAVCRGYLVDPVNRAADGSIALPSNHQMYFAGGEPHEINGTSMRNVLGEGTGNNFPVFSGKTADFYFSHKIQTAGGAREYIALSEKVINYFRRISGPAEHKFPGAIASMLGVDLQSDYDPPFKFPDMHTAAAGLDNYNKNLLNLTVGLVGLGGTGSYILDFLSKTPVKKIKLFDFDQFEIKNSFRSPGTSSLSDFTKRKIDVYLDRYSNFRTGIEAHDVTISGSNIELLGDCDFIFLAIDNGVARKQITGLLNDRGMTYIDVGMGLERADDGLFGMVRTTFVSDETRAIVSDQNAIPFVNAEQGEYLTNIQIAEWNALNAAVAVIRFKSHFGFYADDVKFFRHLISSRRFSSFVNGMPKC